MKSRASNRARLAERNYRSGALSGTTPENRHGGGYYFAAEMSVKHTPAACEESLPFFFLSSSSPPSPAQQRKGFIRFSSPGHRRGLTAPLNSCRSIKKSRGTVTCGKILRHGAPAPGRRSGGFARRLEQKYCFDQTQLRDNSRPVRALNSSFFPVSSAVFGAGRLEESPGN